MSSDENIFQSHSIERHHHESIHSTRLSFSQFPFHEMIRSDEYLRWCQDQTPARVTSCSSLRVEFIPVFSYPNVWLMRWLHSLMSMLNLIFLLLSDGIRLLFPLWCQWCDCWSWSSLNEDTGQSHPNDSIFSPAAVWVTILLSHSRVIHNDQVWVYFTTHFHSFQQFHFLWF